MGDEDNYGLEMSAYLNEEDILMPGESKRPGILRFCIPNPVASATAGKPGQEGVKKKLSDYNKIDAEEVQNESRKEMRKSDALPRFSSEEESNKASDDELPDYDIDNIKHVRKSPLEEFEINLIDIGTSDTNDTEDDKEEVGEINQREIREAESVKTIADNTRVTVLRHLDKWKKKGQGKVKSGAEHAKIKGSKKAEREGESEKLKKKKRISSAAQSVLEAIANDDADQNDFEETMDVPRNCRVSTLSEEISDKAVEKVVYESVTSNSDVELDTLRNAFEVDPKLCQVFPIFTSETALIQYVPSRKQSVVTQDGPDRVKTPPSLQELMETLKYMELKDRLSPIDILDLVDKWEKEKRSNSSSPTRSPVREENRSEECCNKVSISQTSIKIDTLSGQYDLVSTRQKRKEVNGATCSDRNNWSSDGIEIADVISEVDMVGNELDEVFAFQNAKRVEDVETTASVYSKESDVDNAKGIESLDYKQIDREYLKNEENIVARLEATDTGDTRRIVSLCSNDVRRKPPVRDIHVWSDYKRTECDEIGSTISMGSKSSTSSKGGNSIHSDDTASIIVPPQNTSTSHSIVGDRLKTPRPSYASTPLQWSKSKARSLVQTVHESFFENNLDDSVFAAVRTPFSGKTTQRSLSTSMQVSPKPGDTSQITFSQALACVHDSSNSDGSRRFGHRNSPRATDRSTETISERSASPVFSIPDEERHKLASAMKNDERASWSIKEENLGLFQSKCQDAATEDSVSSSVTPVKVSTESPCLEQPQFDLGFDFSDLDEDEIIPPSPAAIGTQPFTERFVRSFSSNNLTRKNSESFITEVQKSEDLENKSSDIEWKRNRNRCYWKL